MSKPILVDGKAIRIRECRYGRIGFFTRDYYVGRSLDLYGEFSEGEVAVFRDIVKPGDVVVEVGANIGTHTIFLAQAVGASGRLIAIEPQRRVYQLLCANLAMNELLDVEAHHCGLGSAPGTMQVPRYSLDEVVNVGGVSLETNLSDSPSEEVVIRTLDSYNLDRLDFLKVDVEGMEREVLAGGMATIMRCRPLLYVECDRADKTEALMQQIADMGYEAWWHTPKLFNESNFYGNKENVFGTTASVNLFCIPSELAEHAKSMENAQLTNEP